MSLIASILLIIFLIAGGAFFSLSEISLAASRRARLEIMLKDGEPRAQDVLTRQKDSSDFFTISQIGLNCIGISTGMIAEPSISPHMSELISLFYTGQWLDTWSFWLTFLVITSFMIVFSDILPKRLAMMYPEYISVRTVRHMMRLVKILKPIAWIFDQSGRLVFKIFGLPNSTDHNVTSDEVYAMVDAGAQAGNLLPQERNIISQVLDLQDRNINSAMTTREDIVYLHETSTQEEVLDAIQTHAYSNIIICGEELDQVRGYIRTAEILKKVLKQEPFSLHDPKLVHPAMTLPDSLDLWETLEQLKTAHKNFALVINEYGFIVGLVSKEDITNVLMGNLAIIDPADVQITPRDDHSWHIDGLTPVDDVTNELKIGAFPNDATYETLAGFILNQLRRVPQKGDIVVYEGYRFEVISLEGYKITKVLVTRQNSHHDTDANTKTKDPSL